MGNRAAQTFGKVKGAGAEEITQQLSQESDADASLVPGATGDDRGKTVIEDPGAAARARELSVMRGGPGVDEIDGGEESAASFSFSHGERTFTSQEDLTAYLDDLNNRATQVKEVIVERTPAAPAPKEPAGPSQDDLDLKAAGELLFTDPEKALAMVKDVAKRQAKTELTASYQADQVMKEFWSKFEADYPQLKKHRDLIENYVMKKHWAAMGPMTLPDAVKHLGTESVKMLAEMGVAAPKAAGKQRTITESGRTSATGAPATREQKNEEPEVKTLAQILKSRQASRRAAALN